jgi:drug/metabolite transporter (DMT)-like permease
MQEVLLEPRLAARYKGAMTTPGQAAAADVAAAAARLRASRLALLALLAGALATSMSGIFIKLSELPPTATGFHRLFLSAPLLFLWLRWERPRRTGFQAPGKLRDYAELGVAGSLFGINTALWCWSMRYTSVANGQFIANMAPIFVALAAFLFLHERFTRNFLMGLALAVLGVSALMGQSIGLGGAHLLGDLFALGAAILWASYLIALQHLRQRFSTATIMTWTGVASAILLFLASVAAGEPLIPHTLGGWGAVLGLAFVSQVAGQGLITYALAHLPASFSSLGLLIQPIYAMITAWPILGEAPTLVQVLGGLVILSGIAIARRRAR